jgi:hypothetical protein
MVAHLTISIENPLSIFSKLSKLKYYFISLRKIYFNERYDMDQNSRN